MGTKLLALKKTGLAPAAKLWAVPGQNILCNLISFSQAVEKNLLHAICTAFNFSAGDNQDFQEYPPRPGICTGLRSIFYFSFPDYIMFCLAIKPGPERNFEKNQKARSWVPHSISVPFCGRMPSRLCFCGSRG
jgi:hypothetical protein